MIAAATGYPLAIISQLSGSVVGLEDNEDKVVLIQAKMQPLGLSNVSVVCADLKAGHAALKPYDVIFINGAVETIPQEITDQLKNNGKLITVKIDPENPKLPGYGVVVHKVGKTVSEAKEFQAFTPRLKEFDQPRRFTF